ncbi:MAG: efflux RND transporter periplasmic adaptor subunit [Desulfomonilaceae bacterium]
MSRAMRNAAFLLSLSGLLLFGACSEPPKPTVQPPSVTIVIPEEKEVIDFLEYTGNTAAIETVDIRARVAGFLTEINFTPMARVKAGDLLFVIDPRQYKAAVKQAQGQVEAKESAYKIAKIDEDTARSLETKEAVSWLKWQQAVARSGQAKGELEVAQAQLENAKLNLEFTQVTTPINGRVSRNLVDIGNLVGAVEKTLLTTVVNDEKLYAYFNVNERDLLLLKRIHAGAGNQNVKDKKIPITLGLADEKDFPHHGSLDFADVKMNPETGTIQCRAIFENPDGFLLPGMFARLRIPIQKRKVLLIPDTAILFDQAGKYVLVVDDKNEVQPPKRVKTGREQDGMMVIQEGLTTQDRVISTGTLRVRPGIKVRPIDTQAEKIPSIPQTSPDKK